MMMRLLGRRWVARLAAVVTLVLVGLGVNTATAAADSDNCNPPPGVPDVAGSGMQGGIDDRPMGGSGDTLYEQYGWSGLGWHTCDLGEDGWIAMPDAAKDPGAFMDTSAGSMMMGGASTLAAFMTQLAEWTADPGALLEPIDGAMASIASAVEDSVWGPWASVVVVGAGCCVAWWATKGNPRRAFRTVLAILFAALAVAALGRTWQTPEGPKPGAVAMGQFFDSAASEVIGQVSAQTVGGGSTANIAYGATLYDQVLVPLWVEGAVGRGAGDATSPGTLAHDIFRANTMSWEEATSGSVTPESKKEAYIRVAKILDGKEDGAYPANSAQYNQLTGVSGGRAGIGFQALLTMILIGIIRIPASIFMLMGLIVIRFVVMFIPIWALFAIIEKTRPTAITAGKMVFASVYNAAVFGTFGVVYTAAVAAIIASPNPAGFTFSKLMLIGALTIVVWVVSKPFRSVTVPATGDALAGANQGVSSGLGAVKAFGSMFLANKLANRGLERNTDKPKGQLPNDAQSSPELDSAGAGAEDRGYSLEQVHVVPAAQRRPALRNNRVPELPPPPPASEPVPAPDDPKLPPGLPVKALPESPVKVSVPVEVEHEVIEPSRVLEVSSPEIQAPQPERVPVPVMATMEQDSSGQWERREWKEVWRPPSTEPEKPVWEDKQRWRTPEKPWTPPAHTVPSWSPPTATPPPVPTPQPASPPQPPSRPSPASTATHAAPSWTPPRTASSPPPPPPPPSGKD